MPGEVKVTSIIDIASINKEVDETKSLLSQLDATIKQIKPVSINIMNAEGVLELKKVQADIVSLMKQVKSVYESATKAAMDYKKVKQQQEKTAQTEIKTKKDQLSFEQALQREKNKGLSQSKAEEKIAEQLTNEYYQLVQALKDAENKYKTLYLVAGKDNPQTKAALQNALSTRKILDDIDQSLGNHQRNVGNYSSAFNGLGNSVQQILRETPSAAVSLNTFFLAISNNLPILFDEIQKAKGGLKDLKIAAEEANTALSQQTELTGQ